MNLTSERLILSEITDSDIADLHQMNSHFEVSEFNTIGIPEDIHTTAKLFENILKDRSQPERKYFGWTIKTKEDGVFVGEMGMNLKAARYRCGEIHYSLLPQHWGNGYATETVQTVLDFGFGKLGLHRIEAGVATSNVRSIRLLEKVGMQREGMHRKILPIRGDWQDNYSYAILETDPRK